MKCECVECAESEWSMPKACSSISLMNPCWNLSICFFFLSVCHQSHSHNLWHKIGLRHQDTMLLIGKLRSSDLSARTAHAFKKISPPVTLHFLKKWFKQKNEIQIFIAMGSKFSRSHNNKTNEKMESHLRQLRKVEADLHSTDKTKQQQKKKKI